MGAAQSKKRRKERKRRRRLQTSLTADFDIPRSASVDVIRSLNVSTSPCPHCQTLASHRAHSASLGRGTSQQSFLDSVGNETSRRTFHDSFGGLSHSYQYHRCVRDHIQDVSDFSDGYESCPSFLPSSNYLASSSPTVVGGGLKESTASLAKSVPESSSHARGSRSSEFLGVPETLGRRETSEERSTVSDSGRLLLDRDSRQVHTLHCNVASTVPRRTEHTEQAARLGNRASHSQGDITFSSSPQPLKAQKICNDTDNELSSSRRSEADSCQKSVGKVTVSVLDDETAILARWEKQKFMAQQLRILRKHIQAHESSSAASVPPPLPLFSDGETNTCSGESVAAEGKSLEQPQVFTPLLDANGHVRGSKPPRKPPRKKFTKMSNYKYLDSHPVLSKLQNEQNNRLESMERRMKEIRISAMQEAERRKFAEIFPAKEDNSETERMIQEAREMLEKLKEEKRVKNRSQLSLHEKPNIQDDPPEQGVPLSNTENSSLTGDSGDIVPVRVLHLKENDTISTSDMQREISSQGSQHKQEESAKKLDWVNEMWPNINLGHPLTWLWLPFLIFPLILRLILSFIIKSPTNSSRSNNVRGSNLDSTRNKPKQ